MKKKAKDLTPGDRVIDGDQILTVKSNTNGVYRKSRLITWREKFYDGTDWTSLANNDEVEIAQ